MVAPTPIKIRSSAPRLRRSAGASLLMPPVRLRPTASVGAQRLGRLHTQLELGPLHDHHGVETFDIAVRREKGTGEVVVVVHVANRDHEYEIRLPGHVVALCHLWSS